VSQFLIERRQFLILTSAAVAGLATSDLTAATISADALPTIAVGFVDGEFDDAYRGTPPIVAAESLTAGEPRFLSHDARVRVLGIWRKNPSDPRFVSLKAYFPTELAVGGKAPFFAWNYTSTSPVQRLANFTIPVTGEGLQFEIETGVPSQAAPSATGRRHASGGSDVALRTSSDLRSAPAAITLSMGTEGGATKLRAGRYVIALVPPGAAQPDWKSFRFEPADVKPGGLGPLRAATIFGDALVPFDYILIRVDYA